MFRRNKLRVPVGAVIVIHLSDGTSVAGAYHGVRCGVVGLTKYSIEQNGVMHEMRGEGLRVPYELVKLVEVKAS